MPRPPKTPSAHARRSEEALLQAARVMRAGTDALKLYGPGAPTHFAAVVNPATAGFASLGTCLVGFGHTRTDALDDLATELHSHFD